MPTTEERLERAEAALIEVIKHARHLQDTHVGSYDEYNAAIVDAGNRLEEVVEELGYSILSQYESRIVATSVVDTIAGHENEYVRVWDGVGVLVGRGFVQHGPVVPYRVRPDGLCVAEPFAPALEHTVELCELRSFW